MNRTDTGAFLASELSTGEGLKLLGVMVFLVLLIAVPAVILFVDERRRRPDSEHRFDERVKGDDADPRRRLRDPSRS